MNTRTPLHVVLGASGVIGKAVTQELKSRNLPVRLVDRTEKIQKEIVAADLLNKESATAALHGATHVYLCVGLPYNTHAWESQWPIIMQNVIDICATIEAKIIFLDNIYMYGPAPLQNPITESHSQTPSSKKGVLRKKISDLLLQAHEGGRVEAVIGRSVDFYGPGAKTSMLYQTIFLQLLAHKKTQWIGSPTAKHTFAYTIDNARALVELALDESSYGQVWHLPVESAVSAEEVVEDISAVLGKKQILTTLPRGLVFILAWFIPALKESYEMLYQYDNDCVLSDAKFRAHFPQFKTTPLTIGLAATLKSF